MESKICSMRNFGKHIEYFYKIFTECKDCNSKRGLKRYYDKKNRISNQRKVYYEKNRDKLLQRQNDRYTHFEQLVRSYIESENKRLGRNFPKK